MINTLRYLNRTGCQWAFLPHDLLPKSTVYDYFVKYRDHGVWQQVVDALRGEVRQVTPKAPGQDGMREPTPSAACSRTESVKQIWTGKVTEVAVRYGEHAPMATVCCNACRACATTT